MSDNERQRAEWEARQMMSVNDASGFRQRKEESAPCSNSADLTRRLAEAEAAIAGLHHSLDATEARERGATARAERAIAAMRIFEALAHWTFKKFGGLDYVKDRIEVEIARAQKALAGEEKRNANP